MSQFIGARISLISRSDIRYVGILHEINSEDSTVSLQNVKSFGSEGRRANPDDEVPASEQIYDYIVFRGTDVKDLRIEETAPPKENKPPVMPDDPAILGARPRPGNVAPGPPGPPGPLGPGPNHGPGPQGMPNQQGPPPGAPGFGGYYPPHMAGGWGRAGPPGPGGFGGMPGQYGPPPPQWYPPGGPDFQQPMGPGGWNNYPYQPGPPGPPGPPGHPGAPTGPGQAGRASANHTPNNQAAPPKPAPIGPSADRKPATPAQQPGSSSDPKPAGQPTRQPTTASAPTPPVESKPSLGEVKAAAAALPSAAPAPAPVAQQAPKPIPTGPKVGRPGQILPAVPLPVALTSRNQPQTQASSAKPMTESAVRDATQIAKAAVASAMAAVASITPQQMNGNSVENLTNKVHEMRVGAPRSSQPPSRGSNNPGRGRGPRPTKVEVPASDFDFASSNAKFNKQEVVKEAISGSPSTEAPVGQPTPEVTQESTPVAAPAYNKSTSFFDNISSEAKDRSENSSQKPGGREWRGEEQRKNMETFGQGSVDGGYRGYRGRGRGRGGRGRGYRGGRGNAGAYPSTQGPL